MNSLKQILFNEYAGFADKRIKRLEIGTIFAIDDRTQVDFGSDKKHFSYFCTVFVEVFELEPNSPEGVVVSLNGNVPDSAGVRAWVKTHTAQYQEGPTSQSLKIKILPGEQTKLRTLAKIFRAIVAEGAPNYSVPNYKYVCPRTASSLERLADLLDQTWL
jgi:hypothetical protein